MSTNPGVTSAPSASIVRFAAPSPCPTATIVPPAIATSAVRAGPPVPSMTVPPRTTRSCMAGLSADLRHERIEIDRAEADTICQLLRDLALFGGHVVVRERDRHRDPQHRVRFLRVGDQCRDVRDRSREAFALELIRGGGEVLVDLLAVDAAEDLEAIPERVVLLGARGAIGSCDHE